MEEKIILLTKYTIDGGSAWFLSGGGLDVFCHITIGVWSRPKRETSCFSSLGLARPQSKYHHAFFIYSIFLDRLFGCPPYQRVIRQPLKRTKMLIPFVCRHSWFLGVCHTTYRSSSLSLGQMMMLTLQEASSKITLYVIFATSGSYLQDAEGLVPNHLESIARVSASAMNCGIVGWLYWQDDSVAIHAFHSPMGHLADHSQPFWSWPTILQELNNLPANR